FKGEGVLHTERYQGQGWGLLQVLEAMHGNSDSGAPDEFARAARMVLTRRVQNSPVDRHESRWLTGWLRRVTSYNGGSYCTGNTSHPSLRAFVDGPCLFNQRPVPPFRTKITKADAAAES